MLLSLWGVVDFLRIYEHSLTLKLDPTMETDR